MQQDYATDIIKSEIFKGLQQVDSSFFISNFEISLDKETRHLKVGFVAQSDSGEEIKEVVNYV